MSARPLPTEPTERELEARRWRRFKLGAVMLALGLIVLVVQALRILRTQDAFDLAVYLDLGSFPNAIGLILIAVGLLIITLLDPRRFHRSRHRTKDQKLINRRQNELESYLEGENLLGDQPERGQKL